MSMYTFTFGKYKGQEIESVYAIDQDYIRWVADNSYVKVAKRAANIVLSNALLKEEEASDAILEALKKIGKSKPHPNLKKYRYIEKQLRGDYACVSFCTHKLDMQAIFDEDWDIVEIATHWEHGETEYDEEEDVCSDFYSRGQKPAIGTIPTAEASIWSAFPDNSGLKSLNDESVTLAEAVELLEAHLAKKGVNQ